MKKYLHNIIKEEPKEIDLALSGSGTRLLGHIGALKALEELNFKPVRMAATSGGAIIASLYCAGISISDIEKAFLEFDLRNVKTFCPWMFKWRGGIYSNKPLIKVLDTILQGITMEELKTPLTITSFDVKRKRTVLLDSKNFPNLKVSKAAAISSSIPVYFGYYTIKDPKTGKKLILTDGSMSKNLPIDIMDNQGRKSLGIWIRGESPELGICEKADAKEEIEEHLNFVTYIKNVLTAYSESLAREHIEDADWVKTIPVIIEGIRATTFDLSLEQKQYMIDAGYNAVMKWYN